MRLIAGGFVLLISLSRYRWKVGYGPKRIPRLPPELGQSVLATLEKSLNHAALVEFTALILKNFKPLSAVMVKFVAALGTLDTSVIQLFVFRLLC